MGRQIRHNWTQAEIRYVRKHYRYGNANAVANRLGIPVNKVRAMAFRQGIAGDRKIVDGPQLRRFINARHKKGWTDAEVVAEWNLKHPRKTLDRRWLSTIRRNKMGLPHNAYSQHRRDTVATRTREQLKRKGLNSLADERVNAYRKFARDRGWPEHLRPREVQILDVLYEQGPKTRKQLLDSLGMKDRGQRHWLSCKYGRGSYIANLIYEGLVVRLAGRIATTGRLNKKGNRQGQTCYLYAIHIHIKRGSYATEKSKPDTQRAGGPGQRGNDLPGQAAKRGVQRGDRKRRAGSRQRHRQAS